MALKQVKLPVSGMTCAACVYNVQRALTAAQGVSDVYVSRSPAYANVRYDPAQTTLTELVKQVYREGYGIVQVTIELAISDMTSADDIDAVEHVIKACQGVLNVEMDRPYRKVQVRYISSVVDPDSIIHSLEAAGFTALYLPQPTQEPGLVQFFRSIFGTGKK